MFNASQTLLLYDCRMAACWQQAVALFDQCCVVHVFIASCSVVYRLRGLQLVSSMQLWYVFNAVMVSQTLLSYDCRMAACWQQAVALFHQCCVVHVFIASFVVYRLRGLQLVSTMQLWYVLSQYLLSYVGRMTAC